MSAVGDALASDTFGCYSLRSRRACACRYAAHLYISTGTLVAPIVAHAIANHYGLPDFGGAAAHPQRPAVLTAYAVGMGAFAWALVEAPRASPL